MNEPQNIYALDSGASPDQWEPYDTSNDWSRDDQRRDTYAPISPQNVNSDNASELVDAEGRGLDSGVLIGSGDPIFDAKIEALYQAYGPEMVNAAMEKLTTLSLLEKSKSLIEDMDISDEDKITMIEQIDQTMQQVKMAPVTDADGNTLFHDDNRNGRIDAGEEPVMVDPMVVGEVANTIGDDLDDLTDTVIDQWRGALEDNGGIYSGTVGIPQDELDNPDGNPNTGESGEDYSDNIIIGEDGNAYYVSGPVDPDAFVADDDGGSNGAASNDSWSLEDLMHTRDTNEEENQKDGRGKDNQVGNANNTGGSGEVGNGETGNGVNESDGLGGGGNEGGMSSSLSTNNWLVILASALGQTSGKHLKAMLDTGKELGSVDSKENPELFAQLNAEFSAESQIFKMFQEAISTVVKSIGEGMSAVARKS